jgi:tRNA nucleotidyltransferase/poly(A) polymerase
MKNLEMHPRFELVKKICQVLSKAGYQTVLAGGCVRDALLGQIPADFDIASEAPPEEIEKLFSKTVAVGKSFGVIVVVEEGEEFEVATFRTEGPYLDGRHPQSVGFATAEEDAQRRDFTINALFYDLQSQKVIDYVGGENDLKHEVLRAVGDPLQRFAEDHLRILRGLRFMCQLDFSVEEKTWQAMVKTAALISKVSRERIHVEMEKMLQAKAFEKRLSSVIESGILQVLVSDSQLSAGQWQRLKGEEPLASWLAFWVWYLRCRSAMLSKVEVRALLETWRFSREDKLSLVQGLAWFYSPEKLMTQSLGQNIEDCFLEGYWLGFLFLRRDLQGEALEQWEKIKARVELFQRVSPQPLVKAEDLLGQYQGAELGVILKKAYHAQLEGVVSNRQEALQFVKP